MSAPRQLHYVALSEIKRARRNPKHHDEVELNASLKRFGLGELPLIDERTGLLVAGEGRINQLEAMRQRHPDRPPGGVLTDASGEWLVPVITGWASADDLEADAYLVASNRVGELGGWDDLGLADLLHSLHGQLDGVGYSPAEFDALVAASGFLPPPDPGALDDLLAAVVPDFSSPPPPRAAPPVPPRPPGDPFRPDGPPAAAPPRQSAPAHSAALPPASTPAAGSTEPQWFQITWTATHEQRETIHEAIRRGRDRFAAASAAAALAAVCRFYLDHTS